MYRGRLIWPIVAEILPVDTTIPLEGDIYDHVFREPSVTAVGAEATQYGTPITARCQYYWPDNTRQRSLEMNPAGDSPITRVWLAFHYAELELEGLVDSNGRPLIRKGYRLARLHTTDGSLIRDMMNEPIHATQVEDRSTGLSGGRRNLLIVLFEARPTGTNAVQ